MRASRAPRQKEKRSANCKIARGGSGSSADGPDGAGSQRGARTPEVGSVRQVVRLKPGLQQVSLLEFEVLENGAIEVAERRAVHDIAPFRTDRPYGLRREGGGVEPLQDGRVRQDSPPARHPRQHRQTRWANILENFANAQGLNGHENVDKPEVAWPDQRDSTPTPGSSASP